jgi:hypothetical protein
LKYLGQLGYDRALAVFRREFSMPRRSHVPLYALAVFTAAALVSSCSRKEPDEPAVATPTLKLNKDRVPIGSPVTLTYGFEVAPNATFDGDYTVFVHVLDPEGEQLWTDDHMPPQPTSTWKPGQKVEYSRTVFVPNYPYIGQAEIRLGLYSQSSGRRLALAGEHAARREYVVTRFQLAPQSENVFLIYKEGWHPAEVAPNDPTVEWQWTKKAGTLSFRNPKKDATLYIEFDSRPDLFNPPQQLTVRSGGQTVATVPADSKERKLLTFPLTAAQLGTGDMTEITLEVDRTFQPGGGDSRELGIRVYHVFVEPK